MTIKLCFALRYLVPFLVIRRLGDRMRQLCGPLLLDPKDLKVNPRHESKLRLGASKNSQGQQSSMLRKGHKGKGKRINAYSTLTFCQDRETEGTPCLFFFSFAPFPAPILARACTPTPLYTCLVMQMAYFLLIRDKETLLSLESSRTIDNV